ncbi:MAG: hypothetical protein N2512_11690 [Armatimonadetes bacterium]|nr:hypothetical protein [Armatimonadota bacterium]
MALSTCLACLIFTLPVFGQPTSLPAVDQALAEVEALSEDVDLLAKLTPLSLTADQARALAALATRRQEIAAGQAPKRAEILRALAQALRQKRQSLLFDLPVPDELEDKLAQLNTELQALNRAENEQAKNLLAEMRKALRPEQLAVLTGRLEAKRNAMELLDWLRELDEAAYREEAENTAEELDSPERGLPAAKIRAILDRARAMDEVRFAREKSALADELLPAFSISAEAEDQMLLELLSNGRLVPLLNDLIAARSG